MLVSLICVEPDNLGRSLPIDSQLPASANPQPCWVAIGNLHLAASTCLGKVKGLPHRPREQKALKTAGCDMHWRRRICSKKIKGDENLRK